MQLNEWLEQNNTHSIINLNPGHTEWIGVVPEAKSFLVVTAWLKNPKPTLLITTTHDQAHQWRARVKILGIPDENVSMLPSGLTGLYEDGPPEAGVLSERIGSLLKLAKNEPCFIIAVASAPFEKTLPVALIKKSAQVVKVGLDIELNELLRHLVTIGYENHEPVRMPGQFSRRGGIVDIYPMGQSFPVRVEFFGDTIDSLREFDPTSQRSLKEISSIDVPPARETIIPEPQKTQSIIQKLRTEYKEQSELLSADTVEILKDQISADIYSFQQSVAFERVDLYKGLIDPTAPCALDFIEDNGIIILDELLELDSHYTRSYDDLNHVLQSRAKRGEILALEADNFLSDINRISAKKSVIALNSMEGEVAWYKASTKIELNTGSLSSYRGQALVLIETIKNWRLKGVKVIIGVDQPHRAAQMLNELGISISEVPSDDGCLIVHGNLAGGFILQDSMFALVTEQELFGVGRLRMPARRTHEGIPIASLLDLKPGDYVTHIYHGVGIFQGMVKMERDGVEKEFLLVEYSPPDRLFIPVEQIDRIQKYLAPGEEKPKIMRLGGGDWARSIKTAKEGARLLAGELLKLYAARSAAARPPYSYDTPWQQELESAFPYVETPSQSQAIVEVKSDLLKHKPMDRLVCGDVGFGKTEVAVRAAFKAVQDAVQVAVLCPTTILASQHFDTFSERLAPYPITIELMNRFRSSKEQKKVAEGLKSGIVDIVIGTHRLLSKDIEFNKLGLIIIDEEQRFGVAHKEKLKQLKTHVDVLTLTATPIPRTLYMALTDIRDMSVINDPPPGRLAIRTYVRAWDDEVVRDAILRELQRDGQVYVVHNRVDSIHYFADHLCRMLPYAKVAVAHGQMPEKELEEIMIEFHQKKYDILISTTIIENGLDIPNVNTIIVDQADRLGLSQLYQLRGRVGRSDRQAFAYLFYRFGKKLNDTAFHRLSALKEFSELGSGFSLAMRDLQIRGAGELLGAKQHGAMAAVGFELYMQLVNESVSELQGDEVDKPEFIKLPTIDLPVSAMIPDTYIEDDNQRLFYYKRIGAITNNDGIKELAGELKDRYGELPKPVKTAFRIVHLRIKSHKNKIQKIEGKKDSATIYLVNEVNLKPATIYLMQSTYRMHRIKPDRIEIKISGDILDTVEDMIKAVGSALEKQSQPYT